MGALATGSNPPTTSPVSSRPVFTPQDVKDANTKSEQDSYAMMIEKTRHDTTMAILAMMAQAANNLPR